MNRYRKLLPPALLLLLSTAAPGLSSATRTLSLEERIAAQERIERVYYSHQVGANRPFELAVPRPLLERKVRDALKRSVALEVYWRSPITGEMLDREMARMESGSRMPERLRELYAALGNDRTLIREMLARPALTDRLIRSFFASDHRIQASAVEEAEELRARLVSGTVDPEAESPERRLLEESHERADGYPGRGDLPLADRAESSSEAASGWPVGVPGKPREVGPLLEDRDACFMSVLLDATPGKRRAAQYRVAKRSFEAWWEEVRDGLDESSVAASWPFDSTSAEITPATSSSGCLFNDSWNNQSLGDPPLPRSNHAAVWTGSLMLVWGGKGDRDPFLFNTGGRYDPATDTWSSMSTNGAPSPRQSPLAVWTGSRMVVWGGKDLASNYTATGGQYDPVANTWSATSAVSAPAARADSVGAWAGARMVVWNSLLNAGARYNPALDVWESLAASPLDHRDAVSVVSTGDSMIVWGGNMQFGPVGARYNALSDSWSPTSGVGAPPPKTGHTAVWTGSEMIIWGGSPGGNTGGRYNPATDSWASISSVDAPSLNGHSAVWVGGRMVAWRENSPLFSPPLFGGRYDPSTDTWTSISTLNAPA
ncbi:MAG TPA: hypothetical protein VFW45_14000, partial [Candidatus Polarisedimenticolia bacterium]|nr:hypothetical protein [Candidatus Polarisedimenticolia bacterium]